MAIDIGLTDAQREGVSPSSARLADEYVLYTKTRNYHWNVVGPQFNDLHKFFEAQYEELDDVVDEVAERMRASARGARDARGIHPPRAARREARRASERAQHARRCSPTTRRSSARCGPTSTRAPPSTAMPGRATS
jgi:hypothetical protein